MTALFPTYRTPLSASNGANLLCTIVLGGGYKVTHYILDEYKALASLFEAPSSTTFQRCFRASLEGFAL